MTGLILKGLRLSSGHNVNNYCKLLIFRSYAKKLGVGKVGAASQKSRLEVESDPQKLVNLCCGANIFVDGQDPELKPDSEYPDWLWSLRLDKQPPDLSELDPDDPYYWQRVSRILKVRDSVVRKRLEKLRQLQAPQTK